MILITDSNGFLGSYLRRRVQNYLPFDLTLGQDVRDKDTVERYVSQVDTVVHMASIAGVDRVKNQPIETMDIVLRGTRNLLEACAKYKVKRFVFLSTSEVFGPFAFQVEEKSPGVLGEVGEARWTYSSSKLCMEQLSFLYGERYGFEVVTIRPFNVFGPGQIGPGAVKTLLENALCEEDLVLKNKGETIRSWCYAEDFTDGLIRCITSPKAVAHCFNLGNPRNTCTTYDLARKILSITKSPSKIAFDPHPQKDVELRIPNIEKARHLLGFEPKVGLEEGIWEMIRQRTPIPLPH